MMSSSMRTYCVCSSSRSSSCRPPLGRTGLGSMVPARRPQMKARRRPGCLRGEKKTNQDDSAARKSSTSSPQAFSSSKSQNRQHDTTARKHRRRWGTHRRRRHSTPSGCRPIPPLTVRSDAALRKHCRQESALGRCWHQPHLDPGNWAAG
ncbi:hypothetical protein B0H14DRAFT_2745109 [Mycena olivaceomarginata]|nr:hypothetical protein B0H14DRAFT_2745109 [Mycena olivaceomarginata]